jgi:isochorismate synthase
MQALESISKGKMSKVVLASALKIQFDGKIPPSIVLKNLLESNPDSTVFALRKGGSTFMGASPEHLLSLKDEEVKVDCLAATAIRSSAAVTDEQLGLNLLHDEKSRREQQLVVKGVTDSLLSMCSEVQVQKDIQLRKLATVQHLLTTVKGRLSPGIDIWSAGLSLWPTPATGGEPKAVAIQWIQDFESVTRGWYSGVVGCVDASGEGDLVVAIRSGITQKKCAIIYAGSGIVSGSNADKEFEETRWKMRTMMEALGVHEGNG